MDFLSHRGLKMRTQGITFHIAFGITFLTDFCVCFLSWNWKRYLGQGWQVDNFCFSLKKGACWKKLTRAIFWSFSFYVFGVILAPGHPTWRLYAASTVQSCIARSHTKRESRCCSLAFAYLFIGWLLQSYQFCSGPGSWELKMRYSVQHPATLRAGPRDLGQMSPYLKWFERFCHVELRPETLKRCRKFEGPNDQFVTLLVRPFPWQQLGQRGPRRRRGAVAWFHWTDGLMHVFFCLKTFDLSQGLK